MPRCVDVYLLSSTHTHTDTDTNIKRVRKSFQPGSLFVKKAYIYYAYIFNITLCDDSCFFSYVNFSTLPLQRHLFLYCDTKIFATTKTTRLFFAYFANKCLYTHICAYIILCLSILICVETYYSLF